MEIALNITVSILLVITIIFSLRLNRRISNFNSSKVELANFLEEFNNSISRAESNINRMKAMGTEVDENLKSQIKKARFLANDLSFLSEKGESVATNLEDKLAMSREVYKKIVSEASAEKGLAKNPTNIISPKLNNDKNLSNNLSPNKSNYAGAAGLKSDNATAASGAQNISPSKKRALDALLKEIARKKKNIS